MSTHFINATIGQPGANAADLHKDCGKRGSADFVMSQSELKEFDLCPETWIQGVPEESTDEMDFGSLVDAIVSGSDDRFAVEPETYEAILFICPECGSESKSARCRNCGVNRIQKTVNKPWNNGADACADWCKAQTKPVVSFSTAQACKEAAERFRRKAWAILANSQFQVPVTAEYHDATTGLVIPFRGIIDILPVKAFLNTVIDIKTFSGQATQKNWSRKIDEWGLDVQAAVYLDLLEAAGDERPDFRHIVQEQNPPYHIEFKLLDSDFISNGRAKYRHALKKYCECLKTGEWPGYEAPENQIFDGWKLCSPEAWMMQ